MTTSSHSLWATIRPAWPKLALFKMLVFQTSWQGPHWPPCLGVEILIGLVGEGALMSHPGIPHPHLKTSTPGKQWKQCQTLFWGARKSLQMVIRDMKLKDTYSLEGKL